MIYTINKLNNKLKISLIILMVFGLIILIKYYGIFNLNKLNITQQVITNTEIDFYTTNAVITQYNKEGIIDYIIISPDIKHYKLKDITVINSPNISIYNTETPYYITSNLANIIGNNRVDLVDNVIIKNKTNNINITTNKLTFLPQQNYITNNIITNINYNKSNIIANNGINLNLNTNILQLSKVKAQYVRK